MAEESATVTVQAPVREGLEHSEVAIDAPEPWEPFETQLVGWSIGIGIAGLIILGTLINIYLLN